MAFVLDNIEYEYEEVSKKIIKYLVQKHNTLSRVPLKVLISIHQLENDSDDNEESYNHFFTCQSCDTYQDLEYCQGCHALFCEKHSIPHSSHNTVGWMSFLEQQSLVSYKDAFKILMDFINSVDKSVKYSTQIIATTTI